MNSNHGAYVVCGRISLGSTLASGDAGEVGTCKAPINTRKSGGEHQVP
jgi:hypothetical protein